MTKIVDIHNAMAYLMAICTEKKISKIPLAVREIAFAKLRKDRRRLKRVRKLKVVNNMNEQKYAISEYHDVDEVYNTLNNLGCQPMRHVKREKMQEFLGYFDTKCKRSKALTDEARKFIPDGVQHNLAFNFPFPIAIEKTGGAYVWDADGNRYIDFLQAGGPTILGSNYAPVREKVFEMLNAAKQVLGALDSRLKVLDKCLLKEGKKPAKKK